MRTYAHGELMTDEDSIAHYGMKGMKWGVRRSQKTAGISRGQGAVLDRNKRDIKNFKELKDGNKGVYTKGSKTTRTINALNRLTMGKNLTQKYYSLQINNMKAQNKRIESGKLTMSDKLDAVLVNPVGRILSVAPKR